MYQSFFCVVSGKHYLIPMQTTQRLVQSASVSAAPVSEQHREVDELRARVSKLEQQLAPSRGQNSTSARGAEAVGQHQQQQAGSEVDQNQADALRQQLEDHPYTSHWFYRN